jgi:ABC-type antimicrobial peptide transport system permease subunit
MEKDLQKIKDRLSPSKPFIKNLRSRLYVTYMEKGSPKPFSFLFFYTYNMKKIIVGILAVIVVLGGGISVYAYESPNVTEGTPLYGLKRAIENVEGTFAIGDQAQAEYHLKMAMRRIDEGQVLEQEGKSDASTIDAVNEQVKDLMGHFDAIQDPDLKAKILDLYKNGLNKNLEEMKGNWPENGNKDIQENKNENDTGTGSTLPENGNINGYKNYGQGRSDYVNKGQQGERMKAEHAQNIEQILEEKLQEADQKEKELNNTPEGQTNDNRNSYGQTHSTEVNKGQQGEEKKLENSNPQANMNAKVQDREENNDHSNYNSNASQPPQREQHNRDQERH